MSPRIRLAMHLKTYKIHERSLLSVSTFEKKYFDSIKIIGLEERYKKLLKKSRAPIDINSFIFHMT